MGRKRGIKGILKLGEETEKKRKIEKGDENVKIENGEENVNHGQKVTILLLLLLLLLLLRLLRKEF